MRKLRNAAMRLALCFGAWSAAAAVPTPADPASDAPEGRFVLAAPAIEARSYDEALSRWRSVDDLNGWIGAQFRYDAARGLRLSESQRRRDGDLPIHEPEAFFASPLGVCVDLSRFAVETLRQVAPQTQPSYLMIEFAPLSLAGQTLRRHWLVAIERDGQRYFIADSKRPGYIAGPYADTQAFISDYAAYRGRPVVSWRELASYQRQRRSVAAAAGRTERPVASPTAE